MSRPSNIPVYPEMDLKLGIKSSIPKVKQTIALALLLFESEGRKDAVAYSTEVGSATVCETAVEARLKAMLNPIYTTYGESDTSFMYAVNDNYLFKAQIEHLQVLFELMYRIGQVFFIDTTKSFSAERTGGVRYAKRLKYSANADLLSPLFDGSDAVKYKETLVKWLGLDSVPEDVKAAEGICRIMTVISETAIFKLVDGSADVFFNQNEIYKAIQNNPGVAIDISGDSEPKGALRIIKNALDEDINPVLSYNGGNVTSRVGAAVLAAYQSRVNTLLGLSSTKLPKKKTGVLVRNTNILPGIDRNLIFFGAPGTGKSYQLNDKVNSMIANDDQMERVTFHPDYSYAQFVGTYKPVSESDGQINYRFVPGPFARILVAALKSARDLQSNALPYFLVIEEINRSKVAAVFGDIFQLLDRKADNSSEYNIQASEDLRKYLSSELGGEPDEYASIFIPDNMFIWATMNSADQGVFPMDTAFKRRWNFQYIGIDDEEITEESSGTKIEHIKLIFTCGTDDIRWNVLRRAINMKLSSEDINAHEDKLMGPFFIKCEGFTLDAANKVDPSENDKFLSVFNEKVLMYLFEDVARTRRPELFSGIVDKCSRFSQVKEAFLSEGLRIFGDDFKTKYYDVQETEYDTKKTRLGV